jgi:hypothetical protein
MDSLSFWSTREVEKPIRLLFRLLGESLLLTSVIYSCLLLVLDVDALAGSGADEVARPALELIDKHWFLVGVMVMPLIETILLQLIPVEIARRFSSRFWPQVLPSWLLFAALHFTNSLENGFSAGLIGGWYFALTYYLFRSKSTWHASMGTFILHASSNFVLLCPD